MLPATRASSRDAAFVAQRVVDRFAERDADVFDQMVVIEAVAARHELQRATGMSRERVEHVVEEFDVGVDFDRSAVEPQPQIDLRFLRRPFDDRAAFAQLCAPLLVRPLRLPIGSNGCTSGPV
jgi:hypothetical protein